MFSLPHATALLFAFFLVFAPSCVQAAHHNCPLPGQKVGLSVKMYFGQSMANGTTIPTAEWEHFLSGFVTPRFPDGLTVYDAYGQWRDPRTHALSREHTNVVEILTLNNASVRAAILDIARAYRRIFHQQSVGIVTSTRCLLF
jgi:Protein of unknown function (DUF3574)